MERYLLYQKRATSFLLRLFDVLLPSPAVVGKPLSNKMAKQKKNCANTLVVNKAAFKEKHC